MHEVTLTRLPQIQDPTVTAPTIPDDDTDNFYTVYGNHKCQKCPPDEVEVKRCTATTDTECACKNGTFCLPDHACETCSKCTTSCDPGEKKVQDCTPTSDIKCVPDTTSSPPTTCTGFWSSTKRFSLGPREERDDNMLNMQRNQRCKIFSSSRSTANGQAPDVMIPLRASPPEFLTLLTFEGDGVCIWKCPTEGYRTSPPLLTSTNNSFCNSEKSLSRAFDSFINKVPSKDWRRFMRLLNLTDNEIDSAANFSQYANEQHYQMLRTWLDKNGQAATLSVLLEVLNGMDLKGIAEEVTKGLVAQRLYVYEE
ncbi:hypothetical protein Chor_002282 [Crotalus horridus]